MYFDVTHGGHFSSSDFGYGKGDHRESGREGGKEGGDIILHFLAFRSRTRARKTRERGGREREREEDRRERRGRKGHKLGWTPFCSTIRKGKKTRRILDPMERIAERGRASGDGGHSSDSTDGAKERMMIEWGKSGEKLDRGEEERGKEGRGSSE